MTQTQQSKVTIELSGAEVRNAIINYIRENSPPGWQIPEGQVSYTIEKDPLVMRMTWTR